MEPENRNTEIVPHQTVVLVPQGQCQSHDQVLTHPGKFSIPVINAFERD
jgi:hypothetical protein